MLPPLPPNISIDELGPPAESSPETAASYREDARHATPTLRLRIRWYKASCYTAIIMGSLLTVAPLALEQLSKQPSGMATWIIFACFGLPMAYYGLVLRINNTQLSADGHGLTLRHGPLPVLLRPNSSHSRDEIEQIYCTKVAVGVQVKMWLFALCIRLKDGRDLEVINKVETPDSLLYLEKKLEQHLRIAHRELGIEGELGEDDPLVRQAIESRDL